MSARANDPADPRAILRGLPSLLALVAAGGVLGSLARYGIALSLSSTAFGAPLATFVVNLVGCLAIGALLAVIAGSPTQRQWRALLVTGVLGGFTTFSGFAVDLASMTNAGDVGPAALYLLATLMAGLVAPAAGRAVVDRLRSR